MEKVPITVQGHRCLRCGHEWKPVVEGPRKCPRCKTAYWDTPKKEKTE